MLEKSWMLLIMKSIQLAQSAKTGAVSYHQRLVLGAKSCKQDYSLATLHHIHSSPIQEKQNRGLQDG